MAKKMKTGATHVPDENFIDSNITAHISIRLPLDIVKELKRLALNENYEGRYQVLIRDILQTYISKARLKKKVSA